jgi:hypothetical protein
MSTVTPTRGKLRRDVDRLSTAPGLTATTIALEETATHQAVIERGPGMFQPSLRWFRLPFDVLRHWRNPIAYARRLRRGYPSDQDFARMGPDARMRYLRSIGFVDRSRAARDRHLAESGQGTTD